jgi:hypothetical protein
MGNATIEMQSPIFVVAKNVVATTMFSMWHEENE